MDDDLYFVNIGVVSVDKLRKYNEQDREYIKNQKRLDKETKMNKLMRDMLNQHKKQFR